LRTDQPPAGRRTSVMAPSGQATTHSPQAPQASALGVYAVRRRCARTRSFASGDRRLKSPSAIRPISNTSLGPDDHAVALGFAASVIDDRGPGPSWGIAALARTVRVLGGPTFLGQCFRFFSVTHALSSPLVGITAMTLSSLLGAAKSPQRTPIGRNCTLIRGPLAWATFGTACSHVR